MPGTVAALLQFIELRVAHVSRAHNSSCRLGQEVLSVISSNHIALIKPAPGNRSESTGAAQRKGALHGLKASTVLHQSFQAHLLHRHVHAACFKSNA